LAVSGELDMATATTLASQLLRDRSIRVVDLAGVTFIDAAGLGGLRDGIRRANRPILVRRASPCIRRLLAIVGLDHITLEPPACAGGSERSWLPTATEDRLDAEVSLGHGAKRSRN
jgi:anti-anti-sigma factor